METKTPVRFEYVYRVDDSAVIGKKRSWFKNLLLKFGFLDKKVVYYFGGEVDSEPTIIPPFMRVPGEDSE